MEIRLSRKGVFLGNFSFHRNQLLIFVPANSPVDLRFSAEEAPRHARGKRSVWSANQQTGPKACTYNIIAN